MNGITSANRICGQDWVPHQLSRISPKKKKERKKSSKGTGTILAEIKMCLFWFKKSVFRPAVPMHCMPQGTLQAGQHEALSCFLFLKGQLNLLLPKSHLTKPELFTFDTWILLHQQYVLQLSQKLFKLYQNDRQLPELQARHSTLIISKLELNLQRIDCEKQRGRWRSALLPVCVSWHSGPAQEAQPGICLSIAHLSRQQQSPCAAAPLHTSPLSGGAGRSTHEQESTAASIWMPSFAGCVRCCRTAGRAGLKNPSSSLHWG